MRVRIALIGFVCVLLALVATVGPASASVTVYTSEGAFTAQLQSGYYLENFDYAPWTTAVVDDGYGPITGPEVFGGYGDWSYELSSGDDGIDGQLMPGGGGAVVGQGQGQSFAINFDTYLSGPPPTAVGGIFWETNLAGIFESGGTVTITLANLETYTYSDTSDYPAFTGFISDSPIDSMTITAGDHWAAMDHFYVGDAAASPVPEPATIIVWSLLGLVAAGFGTWRRKRAA